MSYVKRLNMLAARHGHAAGAGAIVPGLTAIAQPGAVSHHQPGVGLVTRQQLRAEARRQAKIDRRLDVAQVVAGVWDDVTGGSGVVLVDGKEVKP